MIFFEIFDYNKLTIKQIYIRNVVFIMFAYLFNLLICCIIDTQSLRGWMQLWLWMLPNFIVLLVIADIFEEVFVWEIINLFPFAAFVTMIFATAPVSYKFENSLGFKSVGTISHCLHHPTKEYETLADAISGNDEFIHIKQLPKRNMHVGGWYTTSVITRGNKYTDISFLTYGCRPVEGLNNVFIGYRIESESYSYPLSDESLYWKHYMSKLPMTTMHKEQKPFSGYFRRVVINKNAEFADYPCYCKAVAISKGINPGKADITKQGIVVYLDNEQSEVQLAIDSLLNSLMWLAITLVIMTLPYIFAPKNLRIKNRWLNDSGDNHDYRGSSEERFGKANRILEERLK